MREIKHPIKIENGQIRIVRRPMFDAAVRTMTDGYAEIIIRKKYNKRSTRTLREDGTTGRGQNGYYHSVVVQSYIYGVWETQQRLIDHQTAHDELKWNCNFQEVVNGDTGSIQRYAQSTADLTTTQFEEYLIRCRAFILEWFNIDIPLPGEQTEILFKDETVRNFRTSPAQAAGY